jgi:hypothetical protein
MILNNFKYCVDYKDYGHYSCEQSGCLDEGICRCYKIEYIEISNVNITNITDEIFSQIQQNDLQYQRDKKLSNLIYNYDSDMINKYYIHRVLTHCKVWDKDYWTITPIGRLLWR